MSATSSFDRSADPNADPGADPNAGHAEVRALAHALRAALARRARRGQRERGASPSAFETARSSVPADPEGPSRAAEPGATVAGFGESKGPVPQAEPAQGPAAEIHARAAACGSLAELREAVAACTACDLARTRKQTVFADGTGRAGVVFVGEAPGFHEDQEGVPFVGPAGELLTDIIEKGMGLAREDVAIVNVLKCRPPENRDPTSAEKALCTGWLDRQLTLLDARVVIALGRHAAMHLLGLEAPMSRMRGRVHERGGRKVVATYHPAFLLRSPHMKKDCWQDIQLAMRELGLSPPGRPSS